MTGCTQLCNQGRDCTCITPICYPKPKRTCKELGVCQGRGDCGCTTSLSGHHNTIPPEAGNVRLLDADLQDSEPSKVQELLVVALMFFGFLFGSVALVRIAVGYGWVRLGMDLSEMLS